MRLRGTVTSLAVLAHGGKGMGWSIASGTPPPGITLAPGGTPTDGLLSGTPTAVGTFTFTVRVVDTDGFVPSRAVTKQLTLSVVSQLAVSLAQGPLATGIVGKPFRATPATATGGLLPHTWKVTGGTLPPGLSVDPATGTIAGTPAVAGSFAFSLGVTDAEGRTAAANLAMRVVPALDLVTTRLRAATVDVPYRTTLRARGGEAPRTWKITRGKLPAKLKLNARTGVISGTPETAGTFRFRATVTDALGRRSSERLSLIVKA
jgi:large repetitive protein